MGKFLSDQRGIGHIGVIVAIVVVLVAGGIGWWVWDQNQNKTPQQKAIKNAVCSYDDQNVCKFFAGWKATGSYTVELVGTSDGETINSVIAVDGEDKSHVKFSGSFNYETITIGDKLYTKAGDTWYRQTLSTAELDNYKEDIESGLAEPTDGGKITYTKLGTEDCDDRKCFKYQVVDADAPDATQYVWFDTKDYLLRRVQITSVDGTSSDSTISYKKVSISEPSPVKELGENQYIVPGQSEPTTLPGAGDNGDFDEAELQRLLEQYQ